MTPQARYGCHNRKPITTFGKATCQYTHSALGQVDQKCTGCKERQTKQEAKNDDQTNPGRFPHSI